MLSSGEHLVHRPWSSLHLLNCTYFIWTNIFNNDTFSIDHFTLTRSIAFKGVDQSGIANEWLLTNCWLLTNASLLTPAHTRKIPPKSSIAVTSNCGSTLDAGRYKGIEVVSNAAIIILCYLNCFSALCTLHVALGPYHVSLSMLAARCGHFNDY